MATYLVSNMAAGISLGEKLQVIETVLDFSTTNLGINEDIDVLSLPANTLVLNVGLQLVTAGSNAGTLDVGDGTAPDTWVTDLDADGTAGIYEIGSTPVYYASADTIDLKAITAAFDGKVRVFATVVELGTAETAATFALTPA